MINAMKALEEASSAVMYSAVVFGGLQSSHTDVSASTSAAPGYAQAHAQPVMYHVGVPCMSNCAGTRQTSTCSSLSSGASRSSTRNPPSAYTKYAAPPTAAKEASCSSHWRKRAKPDAQPPAQAPPPPL